MLRAPFIRVTGVRFPRSAVGSRVAVSQTCGAWAPGARAASTRAGTTTKTKTKEKDGTAKKTSSRSKAAKEKKDKERAKEMEATKRFLNWTPQALGLHLVDAPTSPEGRLRDRERENALSAQQVAEFQSMEHANSSEEVDDIATEAQNNEQTESQVFSAQPTVDPTTSASSPSSLAAPSPFNQPPLDLFRKPPRKVLSVSDLVATSWCELQYWYTLTKHGRKPPTQAMKLGTKAHKTLEDQVHTTVPIDIMTREDGWALRIWNLIQGLRTLRATGMTREFEVWGVVDGELVTGIIDQIATECPNQELEKKEAENYSQISTKEAKVSAQQMSLNDFLQKEAGGKTLNVFEAMMAGSKDTQPEQPEQADPGEEKPKKRGRKKKELRYYITDVKTRGGKSPSVPTLSSSGFVPTSLQLQLYYHLLTRLVTTDETTIEQIVERNRLDLDAPFSDTFLAQIGNLDQPEFDIPTRKRKSKSKKSKPPESDEDTDAVLGSEDALDTVLAHNNLKSLWGLMKAQLRLAFLPSPPKRKRSSSSSSSSASTTPSEPYPPSTADKTLISPLLTATYISPHNPEAPDAPLHLIGSRSFVFNPTKLYSYLNDAMRWWRGHRETRGVVVYDAWKCGFCEFRDECTWRKDKEEELATRARERRLVKEAASDKAKKEEAGDVQDEEIKEQGAARTKSV